MSNNNYFKTAAGYFFFDDRNAGSVRDAWDSARFTDHDVIVFRMPRVMGPWRKEAALVGHRTEMEIRSDLVIANSATASESDIERLRDELTARRDAMGHIQ